MVKVNAVSIKRKSSRTRPTMYYTNQEIQELVNIGGGNAHLVMISYVAEVKTNPSNPDCEDANIARLTGLTVVQVRNARLKLTKAGWFKRTKTSKGIIYRLGKDVQDEMNVGVLPR